MNYRSGFFIMIFSLMVINITACTSPIGYLNSSRNSGSNSARLIANPHRIVYNINDLFIRKADLQVFISYDDGLVEFIGVERVDISVREDPDGFNPKPPVPVSSDPESELYVFKKAGRNEIVVFYNGLSDTYSVEVQDPYGLVDPGSNPDEGGGIVVIWR